MEGMTGRLGRLVTSLCMMLYCFGTTITLLIVIGHQFDRTFEVFYGPDFADKVIFLISSEKSPGLECYWFGKKCNIKNTDFLVVPGS